MEPNPAGPLSLPEELQPKLHLPGRGRRRGQHPGVSTRDAAEIKDGVVVPVGDEVRGLEICVIKNVKYFRPELNVKSFGDSWNLEVLENGEVDGCESGSIQTVATRITQKIFTVNGGSTDREGRYPRKARRNALRGKR